MTQESTAPEPGRRVLRYPASRFRIRRFGGVRRAGAALYVRSGTLSALVQAARHRPSAPQVALLLGSCHLDAGVRCLEIAGYADLEQAPDPDALIGNWLRDWRLMQNRISRNFPGREVVGWALSLPGEGISLLPSIRRIHRTFFNLGHHVLLLLDPEREALGFHGPDASGELVGVGFNLVQPVERARRGAEA